MMLAYTAEAMLQCRRVSHWQAACHRAGSMSQCKQHGLIQAACYSEVVK